MIDKNRLVAALQLKNDCVVRHFSSGQQLDGEILHSIDIQELGNLHMPLAIKVCFAIFAIFTPLRTNCCVYSLYCILFYTGC